MSKQASAQGKLTGWHIVSFESRRSTDLVRLLERQGATVLAAPSMREVPEVDADSVAAFAQELLAGRCRALILLTGVGTQLLIEEMERQHPRDGVLRALSSTLLLCRGPKPAAALKAAGLKPSLVAPSPNTYADLLEEVDRAHLPLDGRVYVQEYGRPVPELTTELQRRKADVHTLHVYGWAFPDDTQPLANGLRQLASRNLDAAVFTSAHQVRNVRRFAEDVGLFDEVVSALRQHALVASVGPVTSRELLDQGLPVDIEPESPKMGPLVITLSRVGQAKLQEKRGSVGTGSSPEMSPR